jgi:4-amino-4-deoxy-L-arabinose transferase-like glycosyltransferase
MSAVSDLRWFDQFRRVIRSHAVAISLAAIILGAAGLAAYWVFLVPIYQAPDEPAHLDYAFNLYSAKRLINLREPLHKWNCDADGDHLYTEYLLASTDKYAVAFHNEVKEPPDYGTREYYRKLDGNAPAEYSGNVVGMPRVGYRLMRIYPFAYYSAVATWMNGIRLFSSRLTALYFGARLFSVVLLAASLLLVYAIACEMRLGRKRALLLTALVGFFPLTTFVSSYVQPDNLSFTMVMLSCYLAGQVKRHPDSTGRLALLGLALGVLSVTKFQFYASLLPGVLGLIVAEKLVGHGKRIGWPRLLAIFFAPALAVLAVQAWVVAGSHSSLMILSNPSTAHSELSEAAARGEGALHFILQGIPLAFSNFYLNTEDNLTSSTFQSFWGRFGWLDTPLIILTPWKTLIIRNVIAVLNVVVFGLAITRIVQITRRLVIVARRGRWRRALVVAFSNPLINGYFVFTPMLFCLFLLVRMSYAPQGRNWLPYLPAIFLVATWYAPRALPERVMPKCFSRLITAALILYCIAGSYYAIPSVKNRYYGNPKKPILSSLVPSKPALPTPSTITSPLMR